MFNKIIFHNHWYFIYHIITIQYKKPVSFQSFSNYRNFFCENDELHYVVFHEREVSFKRLTQFDEEHAAEEIHIIVMLKGDDEIQIDI